VIIVLGKRLSPGATIGLISPAGPENPDSIVKGVTFLKSLGFNVKEGKHIYDKWGYLAGNDEDRASDLMNMFMDKSVDMILCIRGGYGTMRMLQYIDFNVIKNNPKIFAGFSDITTLLNSFALKCNLVTFHSPMGTSKLNDEVTLKSFMSTLQMGYEPYILKNPEGIELKCDVPGVCEGILVGGNLSLIASTIGTPYEIDTKDKILFIEDVGEEPYRIDRMLTQLHLAGMLKHCRGFILGQFTNCTLPHYERSLTLEAVLEDRILSLNKPTVSNFMSGHSYPKLTIPIGVKARLDSLHAHIDILEPVVK
jgi:muramoyltetrapeptide carboxypeptidase